MFAVLALILWYMYFISGSRFHITHVKTVANADFIIIPSGIKKDTDGVNNQIAACVVP